MLARNTDPISSHIAGYSIEHSGIAENQRTMALRAVKEHPKCTSRELSILCKLDRYMLARRLPELTELKQGDDRRMRPCRITGKQSVVWELKP